MSLVRNIKKYFMKENFDFESHVIDLDTFHPQLRLLILPLGVFFGDKDSKLRFIWPLTSIVSCFTWVGFLMFFIYYGVSIGDLFFATESFCWLAVFGVVPLVFMAMLFNRKYVWLATDEMNKDFLEMCNTRHRKYFLDEQLVIWKLCIAWLTLSTVVFTLFTSLALLQLFFISIFRSDDRLYKRPLIFSVQLPNLDPLKTPYYEVILCLELYVCVILLFSFPICVYLDFHILLHNCIKLDLVAFDIKNIFEGLDSSTATLPRDDERRLTTQHILRQRMKTIVDRHLEVFRSIETLSTMVGAPLVYQIIVGSLCLCLFMYQLEARLHTGVLDVRILMLLVAHCAQLGILCFLGTILQDKATAVGTACWNCGWHETALGQLVRQDMLIVILRSQQPLSIKFTGLPQLSLQTYSSIITSGYSYYNMLRQYSQSDL